MSEATKELALGYINLSAHPVRYISPERMVIRIAWANFAALQDPDNDIDEFRITVNEKPVGKTNAIKSGYPKSFTKVQALANGYQYVETNWNQSHENEIVLQVFGEDGLIFTQSISSKASAVGTSNPKAFNVEALKTRLDVRDDGIKITIIPCAADDLQRIKDIQILKGPCLGPVSVIARRSVVVHVDNNPVFSNYLFINKDGIKQSAFNAAEFNAIIADEKRYMFLVNYIDTSGDWVEITDTTTILSTPEEKIVMLQFMSDLNLLVHNKQDELYRVIENSGKYFRFRPIQFVIPFQNTTLEPSANDIWRDITDLSTDAPPPDPVNGFDIWIDGTQIVDVSAAVEIKPAYQDSNFNFTSFAISGQASAALNTMLAPGVVFMDNPTDHTDTDVVANETYQYRVNVITFDGKSHEIFVGQKTFATSSSVSNSEEMDDQAIRGNKVNRDDFLYEEDFISGPAINALDVTTSVEQSDARLFQSFRNITKDCRCS